MADSPRDPRRRALALAILGLILVAALCVRLYMIQVRYQADMAEGAGRQQMIEIRRQNQRGTIYDRNMIPLTDRQQGYYYLLENSRWDPELYRLLWQADGVRAGSMGGGYTVYKLPAFEAGINDVLINEYGAYAFCVGQRYAEDQPAAHLIGYLNDADGVGQTGLEKRYQQRLATSAVSLSLTGDGAGVPLRGMGIWQRASAIDRLHPSALITTLDAGLQRQVENILKARDIRGAVVVMDTETGQIRAMASSPSFDPNALDTYLDSDQGELMNKAIQGQYPPGSVFKVVVAAAALEMNQAYADFSYTCTGKTEVNGVAMYCDSRPEGHGEVDLEYALAQSCNCYFAKLGEEIGAAAILEMARRLGLGSKVLDGFSEEETGAFPDLNECGHSGLANLSVGQGSLLVTPIQVTRLTNIIAGGGIDRTVTVVQADDHTVGSLNDRQVLTADTVNRLQKMMREVCVSGTGAPAGEGAETAARRPVAIAGKTGSAEAGSGENYRVHGWFTGYFPADAPQYTVTVFAENGETGSGSALPVFEEIVCWLYG